ncbi:MAG: 16S rRNA (cytosine(1402)-N(4))-methyltransferase RsmH [Clostridia bacterium]|nr:16S rRNA (cytosine(1402)-N(4))-methyltransferase RsmH [Clostridia bacterium]
MNRAFSHVPVLFEAAVESLRIDPHGVYVDCTGGGGGHSAAIASRLTDGRLLCIDRDPEAIAALNARFANQPQVTVVQENFFHLKSILPAQGIDAADGILADLGVSSHQLDAPERGFSFHNDAPLDMRMSMTGRTAAEAVNSLGQAELQRILSEYGEEKFAPAIARAIVRAREEAPIETTLALAQIVSNAVPAYARRDGHPARKTFQALRIYVNGELDGLTEAVTDMFDCLKVGGRVSVITFHSLEDRAVKRAFAPLAVGCTCPRNFPVCVCGKQPQAKLLKPVTPSAQELAENPRSRSAKLRTAQRLAPKQITVI